MISSSTPYVLCFQLTARQASPLPLRPVSRDKQSEPPSSNLILIRSVGTDTFRLPPSWWLTQETCMKLPSLLTAVQFLHSLAVAAIIALVCCWEIVQLYHQLFPAK